MSEKVHYFQFFKGLHYSLFFAVSDENHYLNLKDRLMSIGLSEMSSEDAKAIKINRRETTIIHLKEASQVLRKKLSYCAEDSTIDRGSYKVLRMKNSGLLMYAKSLVSWELALLGDIDVADFFKMINTALSLALCKLDIMSFWGVLAKETLVITDSTISEGACLHIDFKRKLILEKNKKIKLDDDFNFARLESFQIGSRRRMSSESLYAYLASQVLFAVGNMMSSDMKRDLLDLARNYPAYQYPLDDFDIGKGNQFIDSNRAA